ncbi:hypothetical protein NP233_g12844 [Leucocoprinus birnbaumii]|uniref:Uncharacterized protein n=1 Tax=Leucocoprinus birnbaumii TaxID=56174 RepID=A0AAD5VHV9_9AGAR|nr:hypothetical protein NP233_g12844 [Leucocoprinus birnbaumii]
MTLHPALVAACKAPDLLAEEFVEILRIHASIPIGPLYTARRWPRHPELPDHLHEEESFWESWSPLTYFLDLDTHPIYLRDLFYHDPVIRAYTTVREKITNWSCDRDQTSNVFLIFHPTNGVHDAIVDAMSRVYLEIHRLGGVVKGIYGSWVQSLCRTLAEQYPPYRRALAQRLVDDPTVFDREGSGWRWQLRHLLLQPWKEVVETHPQYIEQPPVIILTTGGESSHWALAEVLEIVNGDRQCSGSLLWLGFVSSSSEASKPRHDVPSSHSIHLQIYPHAFISVGTKEAEIFAYHSLKVELSQYRAIRERNIRRDLQQLARACSGVPVFIDLLAHIIDPYSRDQDDDPSLGLAKCLTYTKDSPTPTPQSPYEAIFHFLRQLLSDVPLEFRPHAICILECLVANCPEESSLDRLTHLVGIRRETFDRALSHLKPILWHYRPTPDTSAGRRFMGQTNYFLAHEMSEIIGQSFGLIQPEATEDYPARVLGLYLNILEKPPFLSLVPVCPPMSREDPRTVVARMIGHGYSDRAEPWSFCSRADKRKWRHILPHLHQFDFSRFLFKLYKASKDDLVRIEAMNESDSLLLEDCQGVASPMDFSLRNPPSRGYFLSPRYTLLGRDARTVLVILHDTQDDAEEASSRPGGGVEIYSVQMILDSDKL